MGRAAHEESALPGDNRLAMGSTAAIDFHALCDELDALIAAPPARDRAARARVERTLTDGYAGAMSLEAERLKLERRIGEVAAQVSVKNRGAKTEELAALSSQLSETSEELETLRSRLVKLRQRVSAAA
jgi:chromosome segregation ATPase